jgi:hypothetical protein
MDGIPDFIGIVGGIFLVFLAVLWFMLPFALFGMKSRLDETNRLLAHISGQIEGVGRRVEELEGQIKRVDRTLDRLQGNSEKAIYHLGEIQNGVSR